MAPSDPIPSVPVIAADLRRTERRSDPDEQLKNWDLAKMHHRELVADADELREPETGHAAWREFVHLGGVPRPLVVATLVVILLVAVIVPIIGALLASAPA